MRNRAENMRAASIFVVVADTGGFAHAAQTLGISASGASKAVARLEQRLGLRLLHRTTRSLSLTDEGKTYHARCKQLLEQLEQTEAELAQRSREARGRVRVQLPRGLGRRIILPQIPELLAHNPLISVDAFLDGRVLELAEEGLDVALRFGRPRDARLIARRLCRVNYVLCAAPAYLDAFGRPSTISDLAGRPSLVYVRPETGKARPWIFGKGTDSTDASGDALLAVNDIYALLEAAVNGVGIAYLPDFMAAADLEAGRLELVLPDKAHEGPSLYMMYRTGVLPPRVKVFVDHIAKTIVREPPWYLSVQSMARVASERASAGARRTSRRSQISQPGALVT
jgi:LysR family transcriptional regulator for bpeEF and oprC